MRIVLVVLLVFQLALEGVAADTASKPIEVVNERNRALNAHDLDAFLATYAEDVAIYVYPAKKLGDGKRHLRKIFSTSFESESVTTTVKKTIAADGFVVVESITTFGNKSEEGVAIYEVREGKIKSVRFLRDTLRAKQKTMKEGS